MPRFLPFRAVYPTPGRAESIADLCTPQFDELDLATRQERAAKHRHNFVRFESGRNLPSDRPNADLYARAAAALQESWTNKVLSEDPKAAYYLMEIADGKAATRGFVGMLELHSVVQHAPTELHVEDDVSDRLWQLQTLELQTAPVTLGYRAGVKTAHQIEGIEHAVMKQKPVQELTLGAGGKLTIWRVDPAVHELEPLLSNKRGIILDGAARFEAARKFASRAARTDPAPSPFATYNFVLAWMVDIDHEPISFRSWHRAVRSGAIAGVDGQELLARLEEFFEIERYMLKTPGAKEAELVNLLDEMEFIGRLNHCFGLYVGDRAYYMMYLRDADAYERMLEIPHSRRWKRLDVAVLHGIVFNDILGVGWTAPHDLEKLIVTLSPRSAVSLVDEGFADAAILLNAPIASHIFEIAEAGEPLPPRSAIIERRPFVGPIMVNIGPHRAVGDDVVMKHAAGRSASKGSAHRPAPRSNNRLR